MDKDKEKLVPTNTECALQQVVLNYTGHLKKSDTVSDKSQSSGTKPVDVYSRVYKSLPVFILTPVNTNTVKSQFVSPESNALARVLAPYHINNSASPQSVAFVSVVSDADPEKAAVQQNFLNVSQHSGLRLVTALFQNITSQSPLENTEPEYNEIQRTISAILRVVEHIFATSSEGILITFPCTPGFEKEKVGPADRVIVKRGSRVSFGLCDECELEKKFNIMFQYLSADVLSNLSTESEIKRIVCDTMNSFMDVIPVEYALTLVCNCSLCWFLYMCAKVIYRESPLGSCKLNWSGCPISSYRCLAMRKIKITDMKSEDGICGDGYIGKHFSLQVRFTRGGQKRRPSKQSEQVKSVKRSMVSFVPDLNKVSKVIIRACDNLDVTQSMVSPVPDLNKMSKVTVRTCDGADSPSCSFNSRKPSQSAKVTGLNFKGWSRSWSPEGDLHVFNPVRQFKGNTYTRRKNSDVK
jgi:hypothetical protein